MTNDFPHHLDCDQSDALTLHLTQSLDDCITSHVRWLCDVAGVTTEQAILMMHPVAEKLRGCSDQLAHPDQLTLGDLAWELQCHGDKTRTVLFDNGQYPTGFDSYRGSYDEVAIGYSPNPKDALVLGELEEAVRDAQKQTFFGYKGGDYKYDRKTLVWAANWGVWSQVKVVGVYHGEVSTTLITAPELDR